MKKIVLFAALVIGLVSCGNKSQEQQATTAEVKSEVASTSKVYEVNDLLSHAENLIDKTVKVRGFVTHTCKHSGKRCFITSEDQKASIRVEAGGEIGGFNRELTGSELEITGIVKERRLSQEYIAQYEKDVNEKKAKEDGSAESCEAELSNIQEMKDWMKTNDKNYYSIYYMDGMNYDVVEE
ncbi:hypothetical protein [Massilibacteroides sp.]|uniref:hypothetical protein n=1 Tax=Massilibacteroides sp. TaxID=2034766 RepID=UPI002608F614|nr:hypothetical protein [Massilibacteroides sp.]MDD4514679.1 hypothetical protein [Massilibacteroides sp.]